MLRATTPQQMGDVLREASDLAWAQNDAKATGPTLTQLREAADEGLLLRALGHFQEAQSGCVNVGEVRIARGLAALTHHFLTEHRRAMGATKEG